MPKKSKKLLCSLDNKIEIYYTNNYNLSNKKVKELIDIKKAQENFIKFTKNYDLEEKNIKTKQTHSIRVMNIMKKLAEGIGLNQEDTELAKLIGLLHDVGRFDQYKKYKTFKDHLSIDHADLGVEILFNQNEIKEYTNDEKDYEIIKKAIANHNKYELKTNELTEREELFCKLIKDADKIDIMYEGMEIFWKDKETEVEEQEICDEVYESFLNKKLVKNEIKKNELDKMVGMLSFIYDFNFEQSYRYIKEKQFIENTLSRFNFKNEETKNRFNKIQELAKKYIEQKIK